jgi:small-conductance mechanosensitive channel
MDENTLTILSALLILPAGWVIILLLSAGVRYLLKRPVVREQINRTLHIRNWERLQLYLLRFIRITGALVTLWLAVATFSRSPLAGSWSLSLASYWQDLSAQVWFILLMEIFQALLATLILLITIRLLGVWRRKADSRLQEWQKSKIRPLMIQRLVLLSAERMANIFRAALHYLYLLLCLVAILVYISVFFSVFPETRGLVSQLISPVSASLSSGLNTIGDFLPDLLNILLIIIVTFYLLKVIHYFFHEIRKGTIAFRGFHREWAEPTFQLVRILVVLFALVMAFPYIPGSSSPAFQGISVLLGLLVSFGSSSLVANVMSGIVLIYSRAFQLGDRVQIADTVGDVIERSLLVTRIRTIKNVDVTIPNSLVLGSHMINYSSSARERGLILHTTVTIGYATPWREVHQALLAAARATSKILAHPAPFILQTALNDFYVTYELNAYTDQPGAMANTYAELHQNIQDSFAAAGIEITSPHFKSLRDGNPSTIPSTSGRTSEEAGPPPTGKP